MNMNKPQKNVNLMLVLTCAAGKPLDVVRWLCMKNYGESFLEILPPISDYFFSSFSSGVAENL